MNTEDLIKGAERVRVMNEWLREASIQELEFLLTVIPIIINEMKCEQTDHK